MVEQGFCSGREPEIKAGQMQLNRLERHNDEMAIALKAIIDRVAIIEQHQHRGIDW